MTDRCFLNGEPQRLDVWASRAMAYGDGVFETIAVQNGECLLWDAHITRLLNGADCLGLQLDVPRLYEEVKACLNVISLNEAYQILKITVMRAPVSVRGYGSGGQNESLRLLQLSDYTPEIRNVQLGLSQHRLAVSPSLKGLKTLNALPYVLAANEAHAQSLDDVLLLDTQGHVVETSRANVFWVNAQGEWQTPDLALAGVVGVMRDSLCQKASAHGEQISKVTATIEDLHQAQEIFISNAVLGVQSVVEFSTHAVRSCFEQNSAAQQARAWLTGAIFETL